MQALDYEIVEAIISDHVIVAVCVHCRQIIARAESTGSCNVAAEGSHHECNALRAS